jgi:uncharacterized protein (DUF58 family)
MSELTAPLPGRWLRRPTGRGAAVTALGAGLLVVGALWRYPGVMVLGSALVVLSVVAAASVLRRVPVIVRRRVWPLEVARFQACEARLHIERSGGLLPLSVDTTEHVAGVPVPVQMPAVGVRRAAEVRYPIPTDRRGVFTIGPLDVRRRAVAGLAESRAALGPTVQVRVLPRVLPVRGVPGGVRRAHAGADERVPHGGTDLLGMREYLPGDDLRRLHWATSARSGKLMVREDADPSAAQLTIVLDDRAGSYPDRDMEDAVDAAASLAAAAAESEHGVRLLTVCGQLDRTLLATPGVPMDARDLVSGLAEVQLRDLDAEVAPLPAAGLDIVAVLTGAGADLGPLVAEAGRAVVGVVAVLDRSAHSARGNGSVVTAGSVTVLRGADTGALLHRWDAVVVGSR